MTAARKRPAVMIAGLLLGLLAVTLQGVQGEGLEKVPSEDQCRPYIEKALKDLGAEGSAEDQTDSNENGLDSTETGGRKGAGGGLQDSVDGERADQDGSGTDAIDLGDDESSSKEESKISAEEPTSEMEVESATVEITSVEAGGQDVNSVEEAAVDEHPTGEDSKESEQTENVDGDDDLAGQQQHDSAEDNSDAQTVSTINDEQQQQSSEKTEDNDGDESGDTDEAAKSEDEEGAAAAAANSNEEVVKVQAASDKSDESKRDVDSNEEDGDQEAAVAAESVEEETFVSKSVDSIQERTVAAADGNNLKEGSESNANENADRDQDTTNINSSNEEEENEREGKEEKEEEDKEEEDSPEEEELIMEIKIPEVLRPRGHIEQLLKLDEENEGKEKAVEKVTDIVLRDLKRLYDSAIKPLETLYKYRDLSNRHFGDPEIFSKPLVLFMGPWSGGKSSIINYLLDVEYEPTSLRTGAEPSPAYFNILMHGEEEEVLDGTQLAADWTFSGLQKFGQGLLDRLRGYKLNNKLLEKVNIVEIPGILEIRKQVQRLFPFNDACQWFIDRADIIFLVYDPAKLDVGPETEAILDQLKGRECQTRIILNKADQVKPEELMRVQGALIWNISPLMSSAEPPIMYSTSLWSRPYEAGAPTRLLYAQERAFLRDLRSAVDKRVEHKIASARRFAVRVRNHAKMVDCYLTTYYNHKSFFAKKKDVAERIIENPQDYHIYEGLSTLTNISRYDLPDPDVYRDFFRLNNLYEFPLLSSTCTYFRGCPINRLDVAIAYDLPELVGKYKKSAEAAMLHADAKEEQEAATTALPATLSTASAAAAAQASTKKAKSGASAMSLS